MWRHARSVRLRDAVDKAARRLVERFRQGGYDADMRVPVDWLKRLAGALDCESPCDKSPAKSLEGWVEVMLTAASSQSCGGHEPSPSSVSSARSRAYPSNVSGIERSLFR
jgi:hypothetical protein